MYCENNLLYRNSNQINIHCRNSSPNFFAWKHSHSLHFLQFRQHALEILMNIFRHREILVQQEKKPQIRGVKIRSTLPTSSDTSSASSTMCNFDIFRCDTADKHMVFDITLYEVVGGDLENRKIKELLAHPWWRFVRFFPFLRDLQIKVPLTKLPRANIT